MYRENMAVPGYSRIATITDPAATGYVDSSVTTGETYNYYVVAFDNSYNRAAASNTVTATAEPRLVSVTFRIGVPDYTPGTVYIVGDIPQFGPWNPGLVPMTQVDATTWEYTIDIAGRHARCSTNSHAAVGTPSSHGAVLSPSTTAVGAV